MPEMTDHPGRDQHAVAARRPLHRPLRTRRPDRVAVGVRARRREQRVRRRAAAAGAALRAGPLRAGPRLRAEREPRCARAPDGARERQRAARGDPVHHAARGLRRRQLRDLPRARVVLPRRPGAPADVRASAVAARHRRRLRNADACSGSPRARRISTTAASRRWPRWSPGSTARFRLDSRRPRAPIDQLSPGGGRRRPPRGRSAARARRE